MNNISPLLALNRPQEVKTSCLAYFMDFLPEGKNEVFTL
jgi:hypothetical protein